MSYSQKAARPAHDGDDERAAFVYACWLDGVGRADAMVMWDAKKRGERVEPPGDNSAGMLDFCDVNLELEGVGRRGRDEDDRSPVE